MSETVRWNAEDFEQYVKSLPVNDIKDEKRLAERLKKDNVNWLELTSVLMLVGLSCPDFVLIKVDPKSELTFGTFLEYYERARIQFIIINRVNHLLHEAMNRVYDLLEKEHRMRFSVKKFAKDAERVWLEYVRPRELSTEKEAWCTLLDHFSLMQDMMSVYEERLYVTIRDYMIRLGMRDVELLARVEIAFLIGKVAVHSFRAFFKEFEDACGCDFSQCYSRDNMQTMVKTFARMAESLCIKVCTDKFDLYEISGFDFEKNMLCKKAWDNFIDALQDEDKMDETALKAIELNPIVAEEFHKEREEEERQKMEASIGRLGEKYLIKK